MAELQPNYLPPNDPGYLTENDARNLILAQLQNYRGNVQVGAGTQVFRASNQGVQLGNGTFTAAPFSVDMQGNLIAASATINGSSISNDHIFGSGVDGVGTISSNTSLSKDTYYTSCTISGSSTLNTNGWRLFVQGLLTIDVGSVIAFNGVAGGSASGTTKGAAGTGLSGNSLHGSLAGLAGTDGGGRPGGSSGAPTNGTTITNSYQTAFTDVGGVGGSSDAGGTLPAGTAGAITASVNRPFAISNAIQYLDLADGASVKYLRYNGHAGSSRGGRAGNDGGGSGGDGGGSGGNGSDGGCVVVVAKTIVNNGSIQAVGGNGGNGAAGSNGTGGGCGGGGGGAGCGGAGGEIVIVYSSLTGSGTVSAAAGASGTPGAGGTGGAGGGAGGAASTPSAGVTILLQV